MSFHPVRKSVNPSQNPSHDSLNKSQFPVNIPSISPNTPLKTLTIIFIHPENIDIIASIHFLACSLIFPQFLYHANIKNTITAIIASAPPPIAPTINLKTSPTSFINHPSGLNRKPIALLISENPALTRRLIPLNFNTN